MAINSRSKGCKNERKAAKLIAAWTNKAFARTPSSGGLNWKTSNTKGDIVCTTEGHYFPFCVEVKAHKEINFSELLMSKKKGVKVQEFWEQATRDAAKCNKTPLLFMRYNRMPSNLFFIALPQETWRVIKKCIPKGNTLTWTTPEGGIVICPSDLFLSSDYKQIKKVLKNAK